MTAIDEDRIALARKALLRQRLMQARLGAAATPDVQQLHIPRRADTGAAPLSAAQLQLWYLSQLAPESLAYNELITIRKDGPFDAAAFTYAFNEVVRRHESWRTTFVMTGDEPHQVVHEHEHIDLPVVDLTHLSLADAEDEAARLAAEATAKPYDLASGPLLRPILTKLSDTHCRLYLAIHHMIFDGVSLYRVVLPELVALYDAYRHGLPSPLPAPPIQYSDYAVWEREWVQGAEVDQRLASCRARLAGIEPLDLPLDHPRPARQRFQGSMIPIIVDADTARSLRTIAAGHGATLFQILAAVYAYWLRSYTGRDDVVFATPHDLRQAPELESMVGYCLTPVVLRVDVPETATCADLLVRMRGEVLTALANTVPFERLVRALDPPRDQRRNPLFQTALILEPPMLTPDPTWSIHQMETAVGKLVGQSKFDVSIELDERSDGQICGRLIYDTDLFDMGTAQLMQGHFSRLLRNVAEEPDRPLAELSKPDEGDLRRQLDVFNPRPSAAVAPSRDRCIHDVIVGRAERGPERVAVVVGDQRLTYRDLLARSEEIAARLVEAGAGPGVVVATCVDRSIDVVPALLGVLRAGSAYLPLDPRQPVSRSLYMIADAGAAVLLTDSAKRAKFAASELPVVDVAAEVRNRGDRARQFAPKQAGPRDLAYVIYTSGSTGMPKGVQVEHGNVVNLMAGLPDAIGLTDSDTFLSVASYTFDVSAGDMFATLAVGATLVLSTDVQTQDPCELGELIERTSATMMGATPTTWSMLVGSGWKGKSDLLAACAGEPLTDRLAGELGSRCRAVWNGWGPTEATIFAGGGFVRAGQPVTVGRPLPGVRIYVLDNEGRALPCGVPGEIVIAGAGVSRGYVNRPEESSKRYLSDPYVDGARMYRTGDRGRFLADGRLQHLGRYDNQVKVRGFRIELGEVECVLAEHPDVADVAVAAHDDGAGGRQLVAYLVGAEELSTDADLRRWAGGRLPSYMVPSVIVRVSSLPRSTSGKLDRAALPAPAPSASVSEAPPAPADWGHLTARQRCVSEIWSGLLVGSDPHQDFFELGGHSVLATKLLVEVERQLGVSIPVAEFLERGTTLAGLCALVDESQNAGERATDAGDRPHLFFVYPDLPSSMSLRHLSSAWDVHTRVHALIAPLLDAGLGRAPTIEGMAELLMRTIRKTQPHGPYRLIGYSFGGLLTYEIARLLRSHGEEVVWLGLLDTPTPDEVKQTMREWKSPAVRLAKLRGAQRSQLITDFFKNLGWSARERLITAGLTRRRSGEQFDIRHAWRIMLNSSTEGHDVPMNLFVTTDTVDQTGSDTLGWGRVHKGPLEVHQALGDHDSLLSESMARQLTVLVSASLQDGSASTQILTTAKGITS